MQYHMQYDIISIKNSYYNLFNNEDIYTYLKVNFNLNLTKFKDNFFH